MSFGCERSCSSHRRVSNFNNKVPQGGIYPDIKFETDRLNIFRVRVFTSSGSTGRRRCGGRGSDAKTIISPNTLFGDIINNKNYLPPPPPLISVQLTEYKSFTTMQLHVSCN